MLKFMELSMLMWLLVKLWFVGEFCEKWVINQEMVFWWIEFYDYVGEVVNEEYWVLKLEKNRLLSDYEK